MAEKRTEQDYFNVPIEIYKGFMLDSKGIMFNVAAYACYEFMTAQGCDIESAIKYYELDFSNIKQVEKTGYQLYNDLPRNTAIVGISKTVLIDYLNNDKTELEKATLLGYVAIKSIIGSKGYCNTNNAMMLSRMDGSNKNCIGKLSPQIAKYSKHYWCNKIRNELELSWGLTTKQSRGVNCSFKLTHKGLLQAIDKTSKVSKLKKLKQDKKNAKEDFLQEQYKLQRDK